MSSADDSRDSSDPGESARFEHLLKRAARLPVPPAGRVRVGVTLCGDRFLVLRRLGEGGMGMVFEAFDRARGVSVALKTVSQLDAGAIYRLKNEFRSLAEVVHPNLVQLYELFADDAQWLFSMELVAGVPFDAWTRPGGELDLPRLRSALRQLVAGVRMIHHAGKLHRDLKPSNMLVTAQGRVVILDFGLAADPQPGGTGQTSDAGHTVGTPAYMAPEQAAGSDSQIASDWYAVGVILFEALTGQLPFEGKPAAILVDKQLGAAPRASHKAAGVPADLDALCAALLERDPAARPTGEQIEAMLGPEPAPRDRQEPRPVAFAGGAVRADASAADAARSSVRHPLEFPLHDAADTTARQPVPASGAPLASSGTLTSTVRPSFGAPSALPRSQLVGRERELEVLRGAYASATAGRATVLHVAGESGVGKSTLCAAFLQELRETQPAVVLSGRCYERESVPYKAFDRLVDELSRYLQQLPKVEAASLMPRAIAALARVFPVLERVDCVAGAPAPASHDEHELRTLAFAAFIELMARVRDRRPLVLYLDDLQWTDRDSALLLERLFAGASAPPLLLIACHRGATHADNTSLSHALRALREQPGLTFVELPLSPLPLAAATELARKLLPDEVRAAEVAREAGGNPFFVGELCRYVIEAAAHGERPLVALEHALERRVARAGASATRLLALLAISGRPTPVEVLASACGHELDVHGELHMLRGAQLVRAHSERGFECYHDRIRVALAERVPAAEQPELHRSLARAWEASGDADPEVLFAHRLAAGEHARAAEHAVRAAAKAFSGLAFEHSAHLYRQAIALLAPAEVRGRDLEERLGEALSRAGRWAESGEAFARAAAHADRRAGHLEHQAAMHLLGSGRYDQGMPRLRRAFRLLGLSWPRTALGAALGGAARMLWLRIAGERALRRRFSAGVRIERAPDEQLRTELLQTAAGLVLPYDMARGMYLLAVFVLRGLRARAALEVAFALGMLASVTASWVPTRAFGQRLATRALELLQAERDAPADVAAAVLGFVAYARLLDQRVAEALALAELGSERLRGVSRTHAFHAWGARSVQCFALTMMGRMGEAAKLYAATENDARELGDELAAAAGSSVLRYLVEDDVARAERLLAHKLAFLERVPGAGVLHAMVGIERVTFALYTGRGADALHLMSGLGLGGFAQLQPLALGAACAAQAIDQRGPEPQLVRVVKRARARVPRATDHVTSALRAQLDACLAAIARDRAAAITALERTIHHYDSAGMGLHAAGARVRCGELRDDVGGNELIAQGEHFMRAQGIVNVAAWTAFLAPGFTRLRSSVPPSR